MARAGGILATKLITQELDDISLAGYMIGSANRSGGYRITPLVLVPTASLCQWWVSVPKGFSAMVQKHGRYTGRWEPGVHMCPPFVSIAFLVPQQYVVYDTPVKECPTADNVMVEIDVTLVFHIEQDVESIEAFVFKLGPEKLDKMLKAFQEEAVRDMARKRKYNQIYDLMDTKSDEMLMNTVETINNSLGEYGVKVDNITITNVHLPHELAQTMEKASTWESKNRMQEKAQTFELQKIDNEEFHHKRRQQVKEERQEAQSNFDKEIAINKASLAEVLAGTEKLVAEIRENKLAQTLDIKSQSDLSVAEVEAKKDFELAQVKANGRAEVERIRSETAAFVQTRRAEGEKAVAGNRAKTLGFKSDAEKIAATQLKSKREFEQKMKHLAALKAMAQNGRVTISGNNGDNAVAQMLSAHRGAVALGLQR